MLIRNAAYLIGREHFESVYGSKVRDELARLTGFNPTLITSEDYIAKKESWPQVEALFGGWGFPKVDAAFLERFPELRMIFFAAGSIKSFATEAMWERGIRVTSAYSANAVPVCEFTLAQIVMALKKVWQQALFVRNKRRYPQRGAPRGCYEATVGLISLGMIGGMVAKRLQAFDLEVLAYDPYATNEDAQNYQIELVSLQELFRRSDVVSCHAPLIAETAGMLKKEHFISMRFEATFLNTARGAVVDEEGMIEALMERSDLTAILDVTWPEPPTSDSPLYALENVILTPHLAGSMGAECHRMGRYMIEEFERYRRGVPCLYEITQEKSLTMA